MDDDFSDFNDDDQVHDNDNYDDDKDDDEGMITRSEAKKDTMATTVEIATTLIFII